MKRATFLLYLAALFTSQASAQSVLAVSSWVPPTLILSVAQKEWCDLLEKSTAGKVKCNILPRGVSAPPQTFDAIKGGLADVSFTVHGYTPGRFVHTQMAEFPFLGDSAEAISVAYTRVASRQPAFAAEHEGVKVLGLFTHGPGGVLNTKRPVVQPDDLRGLKWRVSGGASNDVAKALGMNATLKPGPESYELLSNGVMDGTLFAAESFASFKLEKIVRYATFFPGGLFNTSFVFMMSKNRFDGLPAADRAAIEAISGEPAARIFGRHWDRVDREGRALMNASGVQVVRADAAFVAHVKEKARPLEERWISNAAAKGLKEPARLLAEFRSEIARLEK